MDFSPDLRQRISRHMHAFEPRVLDAAGLRHAAVGVVVLADDTGRACFVLTRRPSSLRRHSGQWALPGGRLEAGEQAAAAALREIHEEIGLRLEPAAIVGRLDDYVTRSGHLVSPFVLWAGGTAELNLSPDEVDAAYRVPLADLDAPGALRLEPLVHFDLPSVGSSVHAPTAAILYQFLEVALRGRVVRIGDVEQPFFAWS